MRVTTHTSTVAGVATPFATVEVENLSVAPYAPVTDALIVRTKADAQGRFSVTAAAVRQGDVLRVSSGSSVVDVIADARLAARRPEVEVQGLRLRSNGRSLDVTNVLSNPRIAAPGTVLHFKRGVQEVTYTVPADGTAPPSLAITAKPGDKIDVHVGDKKKRWASLTVAGAATLAPDRDSKNTTLHAVTGKAYVDGVAATDPKQGDVGDCWIIAALSAIANVKPQAIKDLIDSRADGTYDVRLQKWDGRRFAVATENVKLSLYEQGGALAYGSSTDDDELWPSIVERAYAQWKGSYDSIAVGYPYAAFEALLGVKGVHTPFDAVDENAVWQSVLAAKTKPTVAVTKPKLSDDGMVADHAYTVLGGHMKNGVRYVELRNPWASTEPAGNGPDDGVFSLSLAEYRRLFVYSCAALI